MKKQFTLCMIIGALIMVSLSTAAQRYPVSVQSPLRDGQILYVGGGGPGNYSKIQDAINNASNGDTIFVYQRIYYENVYVDKSLSIIGQNRKNTIIDGSHADTHAFVLAADYTNVKNFTIQNDGGSHGEVAFYLYCNNSTVSNCTIKTSQHDAMRVQGSSYNTIMNCSIFGYHEFGGGDAIKLLSSYQNSFFNCEIGNSHRFGILLSGGYNTFRNCTIHNNGEAGVRMDGNNQFFSGCIFFENGIGIEIDESRDHIISNCKIYQNNMGIRLWQYHPVNVTINDCDLYNNTITGITITEETVRTNIYNCRAFNNRVGISISYNCLDNTITNCTIFNNTDGIEIAGYSNNNSISNCISKDNALYGFYIDRCSHIRILNCISMHNGNGTFIGTYCRQNMISHCMIINNRNYGLFMNSPSPSSDDNNITYNMFQGNKNWDMRIIGYCFRNNINHNTFRDVVKDVFDTCSDYWDDGHEGNYYSQYHGKDQNGDGIGDTPYHIGAYNFDRYPLMFPQNEDPKIKIISPLARYLYIKNQKILPLFFITVIVGPINITVDAQSNLSGIQQVEFYVDNVLKATVKNPPYSWVWNEKKFFIHKITTVAYSNAGNNSSDELLVWKFL
jgi:parallel beta-helix repeat protein